MSEEMKVYVGNLPYSVDEGALQDLFCSCVLPEDIDKIDVITDRESGRPRGFAFVSFVSEDAAKTSLTLDGTEMEGRRIAVSKAQARGSGGGGGGGRGGGRGRGRGGFQSSGSSYSNSRYNSSPYGGGGRGGGGYGGGGRRDYQDRGDRSYGGGGGGRSGYGGGRDKYGDRDSGYGQSSYGGGSDSYGSYGGGSDSYGGGYGR